MLANKHLFTVKIHIINYSLRKWNRLAHSDFARNFNFLLTFNKFELIIHINFNREKIQLTIVDDWFFVFCFFQIRIYTILCISHVISFLCFLMFRISFFKNGFDIKNGIANAPKWPWHTFTKEKTIFSVKSCNFIFSNSKNLHSIYPDRKPGKFKKSFALSRTSIKKTFYNCIELERWYLFWFFFFNRLYRLGCLWTKY